MSECLWARGSGRKEKRWSPLFSLSCESSVPVKEKPWYQKKIVLFWPKFLILKMATYPNNNHKLHIFCFNKNKKKQDSVFNFKLMFLLSIYNSHFKRREIYWLILLILLRKMLLEIVSRYNTFWLAVLHVVLFQLQE